jgi:microcystin-dependent protein
MAISLKHLFTSAKSDGPDSTLIQPSNWNAEHVLTMATARLLGRTTASAGAAEEISVGTGLTLSAGSLSVTASTYQPLDADLTAIAALVSAADRLPYFTGSGTAALATFTAAGRALVDDADAAAQRTTLGLGTAATLNVGTSANNVVQLDGTAKLPAVDGSALTGISGTPAGAVIPFAGTSAPTGWLLCFGQAVSRTTYAALFAITSTTYGVGDGSTTFNLPDLRGRVVAGEDDMGGTSANRLTNQSGGLNGDVLGAVGGAETHTLVTAELAAHTHTINGASGSGSTNTNLDAASSNTRSEATSSTGSGTAHNNVQPTIILNYIIKT